MFGIMSGGFMFYEQNFRIRVDKWVLGLKVSRGGNNSLFNETFKH